MNLGTISKTEKLVTNALIRFCIPRNILGYKYLKYGIRICIEDPRQIHTLTKGLYPAIAIKFDSTPSRVERAIRHAIQAGWEYSDMEIINEFFGHSISDIRKKPTNGEFIAAIADDIRLNLKIE